MSRTTRRNFLITDEEGKFLLDVCLGKKNYAILLSDKETKLRIAKWQRFLTSAFDADGCKRTTLLQSEAERLCECLINTHICYLNSSEFKQGAYYRFRLEDLKFHRIIPMAKIEEWVDAAEREYPWVSEEEEGINASYTSIDREKETWDAYQKEQEKKM